MVIYKKNKIGRSSWTAKAGRSGMAATLALAAFVSAAEAKELTVQIEAQSTDQALLALAETADVQIIFAPDSVAKNQSAALDDTLSLNDALNELLDGTDLEYKITADGMVIINQRIPQKPTSYQEGDAMQLAAASQVAQSPAATPDYEADGGPDTLDEDSDEMLLEEVIITGSRLARSALDSSVPVVAVSEVDLKLAGTVNLENIINTLPQFTGGQTSRSNNPGSGATQINLRGLGFNRNLVLVNGKRYMYFDESQVTDINTIPAALVERIEVVTGGSSAVYGSDAIAGVTNFILRKDFEGMEIQAQLGGDMEGDALTKDISFTMGGNFADDRGNAVLSINYYDRESILQGTRKYSMYALGDGYDSNGNPALIPRGSTKTPDGGFSNIPYGPSLLLPANAGLNDALIAAGIGDIGRRGFTFDGAGSASRAFLDPADRYNFAPLNYLQTPMERTGVMAMAHYDLSDNVEAYMEASFSDNVVDHQLAEANISYIFPINVDNPYLSPAMQDVLNELDIVQGGGTGDGIADLRISKRFSEVGPRQALSKRTAWRVGGGVRGDLGDLGENFFRNMSFDTYYFFTRTDNILELNNTVSFSALYSGMLRPAPGVDPLINPFGVGGMSQEAADALRINTRNISTSQLKVAAASLTGDIMDLPAGSLAASIGVEWRSAFASSTPDQAFLSGDVVGFDGFEGTYGEVDVKEVFGEFRMPILADRAFAESLTLNAGFRYSDYNLDNVGGVWTYLGGVEWSPTSTVMVRGQFQHAIRAPNIGELFAGQSGGRPRATDPCAEPSAAADPAVRATCEAAGVPAGSVGDPGLQPDSRIDAVYGGNPDLDAESSDTITFGIVYSPEWASGLRMSLDYFDIDVEDAIATLAGGVDNILNLCYNVIQDIDSTMCQAVSRNPVDGVIGSPYSVAALNQNIGALEVSGIDVTVQYGFDVDWGMLSDGSSFSIDFGATWTDEFNITPVADQPNEVNYCVGAFGNTCGEVKPEMKTSTRLTWMTGPLSLSLRHRYLSKVTDDRILVPRRLGDPGPEESDFAEPTLAAQNYLDLAFMYNLKDHNISFHGGINNITDQTPPITGGAQQQANTYPSTYDALGREYFVAVTAAF